MRDLREGDDFVHRSLKLTNICLVALGNVLNDIGRDQNAEFFRLGAENGNSHFIIRKLDIGTLPSLEAGAEPVLKSGDRLRRLVAGNDHLLAALIKRGEGMK